MKWGGGGSGNLPRTTETFEVAYRCGRHHLRCFLHKGTHGDLLNLEMSCSEMVQHGQPLPLALILYNEVHHQHFSVNVTQDNVLLCGEESCHWLFFLSQLLTQTSLDTVLHCLQHLVRHTNCYLLQQSAMPCQWWKLSPHPHCVQHRQHGSCLHIHDPHCVQHRQHGSCPVST